MVTIGIDPHKRSHTAVAIDDRRGGVGRATRAARASQVSRTARWADELDGRRGRGRSSPRAGSVICWRSNSSRRVSMWLMCRRCWRRGCGRWGRAGRTRTIRTMPGRSRSSRCGHRRWPQCGSRITSAILRMLARRHTQISWARNKAACRLHAIMCELVAGRDPQRTPLLPRRFGSSRRSNRSGRWRWSGIVSRANSSRTSPAATPNAKHPRRGSGSRSRRRARPSPRSSGSVT